MKFTITSNPARQTEYNSINKLEYCFILSIIMALVFALTGCANDPPGSPPRKVAGPKPIRMLALDPPVERTLPKEHAFRVIGAKGIGGVRLLPGVYFKMGEDDEGIYWKHRGKGVIQSGNLGIKDQGGIYIPNDKTKPCEVWIVPRNLTLMIGPVVTSSHHDQNTTVIYFGNIPEADANEILAEFQ